MTSIEDLIKNRLKGISLENLLSLKVTLKGEDTYLPKKDSKPLLETDAKIAYRAGFDFEFEFRDQNIAYLNRNDSGYSFSQQINPYLKYLAMTQEERREVPLNEFQDAPGVRTIHTIQRHLTTLKKPTEHSFTIGDFYDYVFECLGSGKMNIEQLGKKGADQLWDLYSNLGIPLPHKEWVSKSGIVYFTPREPKKPKPTGESIPLKNL